MPVEKRESVYREVVWEEPEVELWCHNRSLGPNAAIRRLLMGVILVVGEVARGHILS